MSLSTDDFSISLVLQNGWGELRIDRRAGRWRIWFIEAEGLACWLHGDYTDRQLASIGIDVDKAAVVLLGMAA